MIGPVNLGNPTENTIKELALLIRELAGSSSEIIYCPLPQDDPVRRRPDITLARERLGWEPKVPVREGLSRTVAYFREMLRMETVR
jgi:nucleoside-diphosphate-sugar epimerase